MIFSFPFHQVESEWPESGVRISLGNSYTFSAPAAAPDQRKFKLKFTTMRYYTNPNGTIDKLTSPMLNFAVLEDFYIAHKLHAVFIYEHPVYGSVPCRFNKPLSVPRGKPNGQGYLEGFDLELLESPGSIATF